MEWLQLLAIIASNIALFIWVRTEANQDRRQLQETQAQDRKDFLQINRNIENVMLEMRNEARDFHLRLLDIERKRHQ